MELLQRFKALNQEKIEAFVVDEQEEDVHIEFKTVNYSVMKHRDDKKNFAKALSGFANSNGGIIVWGIDARKNDRGIDSAAALKPLEDVSLFLTKLNEYEGQFVSPIVDGVRHKKIETTGTKGYAASLVPEGCSTPHMAKAGEDRYYKRSGDSFYRMEHFDIEDMFGRRKKPQLEISHELLVSDKPSSRFNGIPHFGCHIRLSMANIGRGIAKYADIHVKVDAPYLINKSIDGLGHLIPQRSCKSGFVKYGADANIVIHPNTIFDVIRIDGFFSADSSSTISDLIITYELNAEDMMKREDTITITATEILGILGDKLS